MWTFENMYLILLLTSILISNDARLLWKLYTDHMFLEKASLWHICQNKKLENYLKNLKMKITLIFAQTTRPSNKQKK